jgi:hypothetical protein
MNFKNGEILEIILFYSSFSQKCKPVLDIIRSYNLQENIFFVNVDSDKIRKNLKKTNYFSIRGVPSLIITYEDGKSDLFEGEKVILWLKKYIELLENSNNSHSQGIQPPRPQVGGGVGGGIGGGVYSQYEKGGELSNLKFEQSGSPPPPYEDIEENENYEMVEDIEIKPANKKDEKMSELKRVAKEMEKQRKKTLGVND